MSSFRLKINNTAGSVFPNSLSNDVLIFSTSSTNNSASNIWIGGSNASNYIKIGSNITTISGILAASNYTTLGGVQIIDGLGNLSNIQNLTTSNLTVTGKVTGIVSVGVGSNITLSNLYSSNVTTSNLTLASGATVDGLTASMIPALDASKITSGVLSTAYGGTGVTTSTGTGKLVYDTNPTLSGLTATGTLSLPDASVTDTMIASGISGSKISGNISGNAASITGTLAVANGGTGVSTSTGSGSVVLNSNPTFNAMSNIGNLSNAGQIKASSFVGDGTQISNIQMTNVTGTLNANQIPNLSADKITTGTLPVARGGTGTSSSTGTGNVVLNNNPTFVGTVTADTFSGSGANLTNIPGAQVSGTVPYATSAGSVFVKNVVGNLEWYDGSGLTISMQSSSWASDDTANNYKYIHCRAPYQIGATTIIGPGGIGIGTTPLDYRTPGLKVAGTVDITGVTKSTKYILTMWGPYTFLTNNSTVSITVNDIPSLDYVRVIQYFAYGTQDNQITQRDSGIIMGDSTSGRVVLSQITSSRVSLTSISFSGNIMTMNFDTTTNGYAINVYLRV